MKRRKIKRIYFGVITVGPLYPSGFKMRDQIQDRALIYRVVATSRNHILRPYVLSLAICTYLCTLYVVTNNYNCMPAAVEKVIK